MGSKMIEGLEKARLMTEDEFYKVHGYGSFVVIHSLMKRVFESLWGPLPDYFRVNDRLWFERKLGAFDYYIISFNRAFDRGFLVER